MKSKLFTFCFLFLVCIVSLSFTESGEYRQSEYYDLKCNCIVSLTLHPNGKPFIYEQLDSFTRKRNGLQVYFSESGDTVNVSNYKDGRQDGLFYSKNNVGKITYSGQYSSNKRIGTWKLFSDEGKLIKEEIFGSASGEVVLTKYYDNDTLIYTELANADSIIELTVMNQKLYDKLMWAKENRTGEQIFKASCSSCHNPFKDAVGPKLAGITKRRTEKWLRSWISNSSKMIAEKDPIAVQLYNKWGKTAMTAFPLKDKDMYKLIAYLAKQ